MTFWEKTHALGGEKPNEKKFHDLESKTGSWWRGNCWLLSNYDIDEFENEAEQSALIL